MSELEFQTFLFVYLSPPPIWDVVQIFPVLNYEASPLLIILTVWKVIKNLNSGEGIQANLRAQPAFNFVFYCFKIT